MRALTLTYIVGNRNCPNDCDICASKMTPDWGLGTEKVIVNPYAFKEAVNAALNHRPENLLLTGKGGPCLYPGQITQSLAWTAQVTGPRQYYFDRIELQTDGSLLAKNEYNSYLEGWQAQGLDLIALSIYHFDSEKNVECLKPRSGKGFDLAGVIAKLNSMNYITRLSCVMLKDYIDNIQQVKRLIDFAKEHDVFQLTLRMVDKPRKPLDEKVAEYVDKNRLEDDQLQEIKEFLESEGRLCYHLPHAAPVFEVNDQNVCLTSGFTQPEVGDDIIRQLIVFPHKDEVWLTTSWENPIGGRIFVGRRK